MKNIKRTNSINTNTIIVPNVFKQFRLEIFCILSPSPGFCRLIKKSFSQWPLLLLLGMATVVVMEVLLLLATNFFCATFVFSFHPGAVFFYNTLLVPLLVLLFIFFFCSNIQAFLFIQCMSESVYV